jgi:hypothetical protein
MIDAMSPDENGVWVCVSTPISPPWGGFLVIPLGFLLVSGVLSWIVNRREVAWKGALYSLAVHALFMGVFVWWARVGCILPIGGIVSPDSTTLRTNQIRDARITFLEWNAKGIGVLLAAHLLVGVVSRLKHLRTWVLMLVLGSSTYIASIIPYVLTDTYAHGGGGKSECKRRIKGAKHGLVIFIREHEGRLPAVSTYGEIVDNLIEEGIFVNRRDVIVWCPSSIYFAEKPRMYRWHAEYGGCQMGTISDDAIILECPYHGFVLRAVDIQREFSPSR